jgi:hypothetical protein
MPITDIHSGNLEVKFGTAAVRLEESTEALNSDGVEHISAVNTTG